MRILVLGELADDFHVYGKVTRLNPEAPTPVFVPSRETLNAGMAGNLAANLKSLRPQWEIEHVFQREKIIKRRFVDEDSGYILLRVDEGDKATQIESRQLEKLLEQNWSAICISSYNKGFLSKDNMWFVFTAAGCPTFADHKFDLGGWSQNCFCTKINRKEFEAQTDEPQRYTKNLVVTLGKGGAELYEGGRQTFKDEGRSVAIRNLSGAGDSFLAGLVVNFLETKSLPSAVKFANLVASAAVSMPGVVAVKQEDLI